MDEMTSSDLEMLCKFVALDFKMGDETKYL